MKINEIMQTFVTSVDTETTIGEAATLMGERKIGSVVVVEGERLIGILTERDIVRALSSDFDAPRRAVGEWMTKDPMSVSPEVEAKDALRRMMDGGFRHLPVCDGDRLVGMVSIRDLAGAMTE